MRSWKFFSARSTAVFLQVTALATVAGALVGALRSSGGTFFSDTLFGALTGFAISACCVWAEFQFFSNPKRRVARRLRPIVLMALRGTLYSAFIVFGLSLSALLSIAPPIWQDPAFLEVFVISALIAYVFSIGYEITRLLGTEATKALIWGRYRQARLENRVILFADVIGSTALAERIGQLKFHDFLRDIALDLAGPIESYRGDIHKYVGDSVIVTWQLASGIANDACLKCAKEMNSALRARDTYYLQNYGTEARLRTGIHCGEVAAGEIGDWKKEVALLGDPMNTAARIEGAAKSLRLEIVLSDDVARKLSPTSRGRLSELPAFEAPGKTESLALWSVT